MPPEFKDLSFRNQLHALHAAFSEYQKHSTPPETEQGAVALKKYQDLCQLASPQLLEAQHELIKFDQLTPEDKIQKLRSREVKMRDLTPEQIVDTCMTFSIFSDIFFYTPVRNLQVWDEALFNTLFSSIGSESALFAFCVLTGGVGLAVEHHRQKKLRLIDLLRRLAAEKGSTEAAILKQLLDSLADGSLQKLCDRIFPGEYLVDLDFDEGLILTPNPDKPVTPTPQVKLNFLEKILQRIEKSRLAKLWRPTWYFLGTYAFFYWVLAMSVGVFAHAAIGTLWTTGMVLLGIPAILPLVYIMWRMERGLIANTRLKKNPLLATLISATLSYGLFVGLVHVGIVATASIAVLATSAFAFGVPAIIPVAYLLWKAGRALHKKITDAWDAEDLALATQKQRQQFLCAYFIENYSQYLEQELFAYHKASFGVDLVRPTAPALLPQMPAEEQLPEQIQRLKSRQKKMILIGVLSAAVSGYISAAFNMVPVQAIIKVLFVSVSFSSPVAVITTFAVCLAFSAYFIAQAVAKNNIAHKEHQEKIQESEKMIRDVQALWAQIDAYHLQNDLLAEDRRKLRATYDGIAGLEPLPAMYPEPNLKFPTREEQERFCRNLEFETSQSVKIRKFLSAMVIAIARMGSATLLVRLICLGTMGGIAALTFGATMTLGAFPLGFTLLGVTGLALGAAVVWAGVKVYEFYCERRKAKDVQYLGQVHQIKNLCEKQLEVEQVRHASLEQGNRLLEDKIPPDHALPKLRGYKSILSHAATKVASHDEPVVVPHSTLHH